MTINKILPLFIFLLALGFTSCDKEEDEMYNVQPDTTQQQAFFNVASQGSSASAVDVECLSINYPITVIFPDGQTLAVESDEQLEQTIDEWDDANPDSEDYPTLDFPITVTLQDGTTETVSDEETLCDLFEACYGDDEEEEDEDDEDEDDHEDCDYDEYEDCFMFSYPLTVVLPDGSNAVVNDVDELETAVEDYYDQNPDDENDPTFNYPIEVTLEDGTLQSINNDEELELLFELCDDGDDDDDEEDEEECFELVYPVTIILPDGVSAMVNSYDELEEVEDAYYELNPDDENDLTFSYPVDITYDDGTTATINSDEEWEEAEDGCE